MDPVRESQESFNNLMDNEVDYSDDAYWVEVAWRREDTSRCLPEWCGERRDDDGVESFETHREEISLVQPSQLSRHHQRRKEFMSLL